MPRSLSSFSAWQALKRLGPKREGPGTKPRGGKAVVNKGNDSRTPEEKARFDQLTELADQLLRAGVVDAYHKTYEEIKKELDDDDEEEEDDGAALARVGVKRPASALVGSQPQPPDKRWEYKGPDGQVHGPFTSADILGVSGAEVGRERGGRKSDV